MLQSDMEISPVCGARGGIEGSRVVLKEGKTPPSTTRQTPTPRDIKMQAKPVDLLVLQSWSPALCICSLALTIVGPSLLASVLVLSCPVLVVTLPASLPTHTFFSIPPSQKWHPS